MWSCLEINVFYYSQQLCQMYSSHMPGNLENSALATGLEKVSFHSSPKERQCPRMFKLLTALISQASKVILKIL